jgi:hypothetical protein
MKLGAQVKGADAATLMPARPLQPIVGVNHAEHDVSSHVVDYED